MLQAQSISSKRSWTELQSFLTSWHLQQGEPGEERRKPKPNSLLNRVRSNAEVRIMAGDEQAELS
jgi:hypothetical protein